MRELCLRKRRPASSHNPKVAGSNPAPATPPATMVTAPPLTVERPAPAALSGVWDGCRRRATSWRRPERARRSDTYLALVSPPVALALDVFAPSLAETGRADDDDLEALRPGLVATPRTGRNAHRIPLLELDDLVVELHPAAPAQDHVHLLLLAVRVAVRKAIAGRDPLVAQAGLLELEPVGRQAELQVRRAVEPGPDVLQVLLEVPERERHGRNPMVTADGHALATSSG